VKKHQVRPAWIFLFVLTTACSSIAPPAAAPVVVDPCAIALTPHNGNSRLDGEIVRLQQLGKTKKNAGPIVEQLGWTFVAKARVSYDPGFYKLAESAARCLETAHGRVSEGKLLRGHVLHSLHRFKEAEQLARELVAARQGAFDYGLLGDVLMEQGQLEEATRAYQKMLDLKPNLQSYSRAAHMRWLKGDLPGALEMMKLAAAASSPRDSESAAWAYSRLAVYELQSGHGKAATDSLNRAIEFEPGYAPALLVKGRMLLAQDATGPALDLLRTAAQANPIPEYLWTLEEALGAANLPEEQQSVRDRLARSGPETDPRTFALYLATTHESPDTALHLAQSELQSRSDVFTLDALAWAQASAGNFTEAHANILRALREGTQDARLFYHGGSILSKAGDKSHARELLRRAAHMQQLLLPSERKGLAFELQQLSVDSN
jgi:tetratricopeptide (TPR) repeat protein